MCSRAALLAGYFGYLLLNFLLQPRFVRPIFLCNSVRFSLSVGYVLEQEWPCVHSERLCNADTQLLLSPQGITLNSRTFLINAHHSSTYHWLVIKRKALHWSQGIGGTWNILEHDKCLPSHPKGLQSHYVKNGPKLRENGVQRFLQL